MSRINQIEKNMGNWKSVIEGPVVPEKAEKQVMKRKLEKYKIIIII